MKIEKQNGVVQSAELSELEEEWLNINWRKIERDIFKIQQRIFRAETEWIKYLYFEFQIKNMLEPSCWETDTSGSEERRGE